MEHNQIDFRAEFTIEEAKIEEYKKLVQDMSRMVEANEPDTINYQFYLNRDETSVLYMKNTQIQRLYLLTTVPLHHKQYFQRFSVSLR
jgi:hypothetical protein